MTEPPIGCCGVVRTGGFSAWVIRVVTRSPFNHAITYIGDGQIVEAQPGGAVVSSMRNYPVVDWMLTDADDAEWPGDDIARRALEMTRPPPVAYGWADDLCVGLLQYGIKPRSLRAFVASDHSMMCSQMCDRQAQLAGYQWFKDHRWPGDVTPGDIARRGEERSRR